MKDQLPNYCKRIPTYLITRRSPPCMGSGPTSVTNPISPHSSWMFSSIRWRVRGRASWALLLVSYNSLGRTVSSIPMEALSLENSHCLFVASISVFGINSASARYFSTSTITSILSSLSNHFVTLLLNHRGAALVSLIISPLGGLSWSR